MVDVKEIKAIRIVPYTLMTSSIAAIWGLVMALIFILFAGIIVALIPSTYTSQIGSILGIFATLSIALIIILPVYSFISNITQAFLMTLIYNLLVPRLGGIKLKLEELSKVTEIPVVPFALILSAVSAVITFLIMLIYAPIMAVQFAAIPSTAGVNLAGFGVLGAVAMLILGPIFTFIAVFIVMALSAIFYNIIAPKLGGLQLNFSNVQDGLFSLDSVEIVPSALSIAAVAAIWGLIAGIFFLIIFLIAGSALGAIVGLIVTPILVFIGAFVVYAITIFLYNFLATKIGGFKLELE